MNIKGIVFDKDGTLFDFQSSWGNTTFKFLQTLSNGNIDVLAKLADELQFDLNKKVFYPKSIFIAGTTGETINLIKALMPEKKEEDILAMHAESYSNQKQVPIKDLFNILQNLHDAGYLMSVATNDLVGPTIFQLREANILGFFTYVIGADSGYGAKPSPTQLRELEKRKGLKPSEILMVGDSTHDMIAANRAGFRSFSVLTGVASINELKPFSEVVFQDISYLFKWLEKQNS